MALLFSSSDEDVIHRKIKDDETNESITGFTVEEFFEIPRCCDWIISNNFSKVVLQFPDALLPHSVEVSSTLRKKTECCELFIAADTSYGSCCVDYIPAEHVSADAIIHFGHACLSRSSSIPVLYIFGKKLINLDSMATESSALFKDSDVPIIVLYEVCYAYMQSEIYSRLKSLNKDVILAIHQVPGECNSSPCESENNELSKSTIKIEKCGMAFEIPHSKQLTDYTIFYIGSENQTLMNLMLNFNSCQFFTYDPITRIGRRETLDVNKYLRKRYYYIERAKDAKIIGILLGTLGVTNVRTIVDRLRVMAKEAGKKAYTISVGKLNSAKLANFSEIEVFVYVTCTECTVIDSHEFYQPIVTPFEMEIACNSARNWTGDYVTDFSELLPGSAHHIPLSPTSETVNDVSLVTGKIRSLGKSDEPEAIDASSTDLAVRDKMAVSSIHSDGAGEFLINRTWKGLEQKLGETPVANVSQGQKGIASGYDEEGLKS